MQEAVDTTPADHPERAGRLGALASGYGNRYQRIGVIADLETAIQRMQEAVDTTPVDHPDRAGQLLALGGGYVDRYRRIGALADLETAIQRIQEAVDTTPANHPDLAGRLSALGGRYVDRYQGIGAIADVETAIQQCQEAVDITPADSPDLAGRLRALGAAYGNRYRGIGAIADLETVIQRYQEAVDTTPADHPDLADRIQALGTGYVDRYQRIGAIADLETAIQRYQEAVDTTPADHPALAGRLKALGAGYGNRHLRIGAITDLEITVQRYQEAVDTTPADHPDLADRLLALGVGYRDKYQRTGALADLETAIQLIQEALDTTPADHPDRAGRLSALGDGYIDRYRRIGAIADLETAIQQVQEAVDTTPADHPDQADRLHDLGTGYENRYQRIGAIVDLETAIQRFQEALKNSTSPVNQRLRSGRSLLTLHIQAQSWPCAYQTAFQAVSLVPLLTPHFLETSDKQYLLTNLVGLASDAAAIALIAEKTAFDAIQVLELGRSLIAGSLNEMRADISELQQKHPQDAEEYISLRGQIDIPKTSTQSQVDQRYIAAQRVEKLIEKIRTLPGFDRFLLAPSNDELKNAAKHGPIAIINVSNHRCDALIIENNRLRALPLPRLHISHIHDRIKKNLASPEILEWLWDTIAQPIFNALGYTQAPLLGCLPRIWWVPTGPLVRFHIHAAGYHYKNSSDTVLDRVISSYSSSVKAMILSRHKRPNATIAPRSKKTVLISMQKTPGQKDLRFATEEIDKIENVCNSMQMQVSKPLPVQKDVLVALNDCKIFHFAGHGSTDLSDPSQSCLLLEDWYKEPLTVASLLETNLRAGNPFLAYLSACGTGQIKHDELLDEGLHLISACQLAGFQHVIGTLWGVMDKACVEMAVMTYQWIRDQGMSDESVSEGLHRATKSLRSQWISENVERGALRRMARVKNSEDGQITTERSSSTQSNTTDPRDVIDCDDDTRLTPLYWVPYVHFGV